jgi:hypothetical protein
MIIADLVSDHIRNKKISVYRIHTIDKTTGIEYNSFVLKELSIPIKDDRYERTQSEEIVTVTGFGSYYDSYEGDRHTITLITNDGLESHVYVDSISENIDFIE